MERRGEGMIVEPEEASVGGGELDECEGGHRGGGQADRLEHGFDVVDRPQSLAGHDEQHGDGDHVECGQGGGGGVERQCGPGSERVTELATGPGWQPVGECGRERVEHRGRERDDLQHEPQ